MKDRYSSAGILAVAARQNLVAILAADLAAEHAFLAEARERVGVQHLGPLVGVVAGAVADGAREQVREAGDHGVVVGQRRGRERLQHACGAYATTSPSLRRVVFAMQRQIDEAEPELPHLACSPRGTFARASSSGTDLRGSARRFPSGARTGPAHSRSQHQFSMICDGSSTKSHGDAGARQAAHLHAAQAVMQQMAELVENRLHFAVRQQRGLVAHRRRQVAADQAEVRLRRIQAGIPVISESIQAPPRLFSRGYQSA